MPFTPNDPNINRVGRKRGSINETTRIKRAIHRMLSDLLHEELSNEQILSTLKKASPSARLRFYADILPYIVPKAQEEALQYEPLNNIEIIVKRDRDEVD